VGYTRAATFNGKSGDSSTGPARLSELGLQTSSRAHTLCALKSLTQERLPIIDRIRVLWNLKFLGKTRRVDMMRLTWEVGWEVGWLSIQVRNVLKFQDFVLLIALRSDLVCHLGFVVWAMEKA
jgi:hypothetical protein